MRVYFSRLAMEELREAKSYYNHLQKGLGMQLQQEAQAAATTIAGNPLAWQVERGEIRRFVLNRFPYKLLYALEGEIILIVALMHQHRHPDYWVERI